jgi:hypothetical protein
MAGAPSDEDDQASFTCGNGRPDLADRRAERDQIRYSEPMAAKSAPWSGALCVPFQTWGAMKSAGTLKLSKNISVAFSRFTCGFSGASVNSTCPRTREAVRQLLSTRTKGRWMGPERFPPEPTL